MNMHFDVPRILGVLCLSVFLNPQSTALAWKGALPHLPHAVHVPIGVSNRRGANSEQDGQRLAFIALSPATAVSKQFFWVTVMAPSPPG